MCPAFLSHSLSYTQTHKHQKQNYNKKPCHVGWSSFIAICLPIRHRSVKASFDLAWWGSSCSRHTAIPFTEVKRQSGLPPWDTLHLLKALTWSFISQNWHSAADEKHQKKLLHIYRICKSFFWILELQQEAKGNKVTFFNL